LLSKEITGQGRRVRIFLLCLAIAFIIWLIKALTSEHTHQWTLSVHYVNLPPRISLMTHLPDTLHVVVVGKGWQFLSRQHPSSLRSLSVDLSYLQEATSGSHTISFLPLVRALHGINQSGIKVLRTEPDTLRLHFTQYFSRRVPIRANVDLSCQKQYMISGSIRLIPDSIEIFGPAEQVNALSFVSTYPLRFTSLMHSLDTTVALQLPAAIRRAYKPPEIRIHVPVSEYAEAQWDIPIRMETSRPGHYKIFPSRALITVRIPMEKMRMTTAADFSVTVVLSRDTSRYGRLICDKLPDYASLFSLIPPFAEVYRLH
jgi:hypothetical protein